MNRCDVLTKFGLSVHQASSDLSHCIGLSSGNIEYDRSPRTYSMKGGKAEIKVHQALLYYALRRLVLDTDPAARKPQDQQIVLLNRDAILGRQSQAGEQ